MSTATAVGAKDVNPSEVNIHAWTGAVPQQLQSCRRKQESCLDITSGLIFTLTYLFINSSGSGMVLCCTLLLFFFFSLHCQCQRSTTESKNDSVHGNQIQLTQGEVRESPQLSGTVCTCMCGRDWGDGASLLSHRGREPQVPSKNILAQLFHQQEYH